LELLVVREHGGNPVALLELYGGVEVDRVEGTDFDGIELRRALQRQRIEPSHQHGRQQFFCLFLDSLATRKAPNLNRQQGA
jgi:hypothetical protein